MKKIILFLPFLTILSCQKQSESTVYDLSEQFREELIQRFTFQADDEKQEFVTNEDIIIQIDPSTLRVDGHPATGKMTLEFAAIYDKGSMALANRPTMGINEFNQVAMMVSGGEYYINVKDNIGRDVDDGIYYSLKVPNYNTTANLEKMELYNGVNVNSTSFLWEDYVPIIYSDVFGIWTEVQDFPGYHLLSLDQCNWINCDYFYESEAEKIPISIKTRNIDAIFYLSFDSLPNSLANVNGEYPIGMTGHLIGIAADDDQFSYVIEPITIEKNNSYNFTIKDLKTVNEEVLISMINDL